VAADDDLRAARLQRPRMGVDVGERHELTVELRRLRGPQLGHRVEVFVGALAAAGHRHAEGGHLRLEVAGSHPQ
jgi:hypothetical protein